MVHTQTMEEFRQQCLKTHNYVRSKHGAAPLKFSDDLNNHAQAWAEALSKTNIMKHSECMLHGSRIGENVACKNNTGSINLDFAGSDAVLFWYDEMKEHNFDTESYNMKSGHFTQVVWKNTAELGAGKCRSSDGKKIYIVCTYRPPGNMLGQIMANVKRSS